MKDDDFDPNGSSDIEFPADRVSDSFENRDTDGGTENEPRDDDAFRSHATNQGEGDPDREPDPATAGSQRLSDDEIRRLVDQNEKFSSELTQLRTTAAEVEKLQRVIASLTGAASGEQPATPDPKSQAVRERMFTYFPELKVLSEYGSDLPAIMQELKQLLPNLPQLRESFPTIARNLQDGEVRNAEIFSDRLQSGFAEALLGPGKGAKDLTPKQVNRLGRGFIAFCSEDPGRVARYQRGDVRLVDEFLNEEREALAIPRRQRAAAAIGRQNTPLPSGGGSGTPLGGAERKKPADPDALFEDAWEKTQAAAGR